MHMHEWWLRWGRERELFQWPGQPTADRLGLIGGSIGSWPLGSLPTDVTNPDVLFHQMEVSYGLIAMQPSYWRLEVDDRCPFS